LELLDGNPEVKVLAGGQSLIPSLKLRELSPKALVDITGIKDLCYVHHEGHALTIGALTTVSAIENDRAVASSLPVLREAAEQIADPLVRNRGTIGGNLCNADPVNDLPAVVLALNASMVAMNKRGTRSIDADSFFAGMGRTALGPDEILTRVEIPVQGARFGSAYCKVRKGSGGFSIAGVASCLSVASDATIARCRIAMTAVAPTVLRAENAERALLGKMPSDSMLDRVARLAVDASQPSNDLTASEEYRRTVLYKLIIAVLDASYQRATVQ